MHESPSIRQDQGDPAIDRPLLLLGTGRSGTTLALELLGCHPELAWISQYTNRFPRRCELAFLSRIVDHDRLARLIPWEQKLRPRPVEANNMLRSVTDGRFWERRRLSASDVDEAVRRQYQTMVRRHLHWHGKGRFLQKHTGYPRTDYLRAIFPDGRFVHVLRDGRAVANSLLGVGFFDGTMESWRWGPMRPEFEQEYLASGRAPVVLAAIVWKTLVDMIRPAMDELPAGQGLTVRYDQILADPHRTLATILEFAELDPTPAFFTRVDRIGVAGSDDQWKRLPRSDREMLEASLADDLTRMGFA